MALDGMRLVYRPVKEALRPTRMGLLRRRDIRERRIAELFVEECRRWFAQRAPLPVEP
ncbi:hypothetical protein D3C83_310600 [compost metagenome]